MCTKQNGIAEKSTENIGINDLDPEIMQTPGVLMLLEPCKMKHIDYITIDANTSTVNELFAISCEIESKLLPRPKESMATK